MKELEEALCHAVLRSCLNLQVHTRRSERLQEKLLPLVEKDCKKVREEGKKKNSKRGRKGSGAVPSEVEERSEALELPPPSAEAGILKKVTPAERQTLFDEFDLTDDDADRSVWTEVAKVVLDEVSETLVEVEEDPDAPDEWWRESRNPVRRVPAGQDGSWPGAKPPPPR